MVREVEAKSEIMAIFNKYNNTIDNFINSLGTKFLYYPNSLNWLELIDKGSRNIPKSSTGSLIFLEEDHLDTNILIMLLKLAPKI